MTVRINKSAFNIREKLSELERPIGVKGNELMRAETLQDARDLVSAGRKNLIINGDMRIDQRNSGSSVTVTNGTYFLDRWQLYEDTDGVATVQRSTTAPPGFENSLLWTTTTADSSIGSAQYSMVSTTIEGYIISPLAWGTSSAKTATLSFWVRSSLTGTFGGSFRNNAANRSYVFSYTINTANTWEYKTIVVPGDTSGTWVTGNGKGTQLFFSMGNGSTFSSNATGLWAGANYHGLTGETPIIGTTNATWYITGVQLEVGKNATEFEHRSYGEELALCQRYYQKVPSNTSGSIYIYDHCVFHYGASFYASHTFMQPMRDNPNVVITTDGNYYEAGSANSHGTITVRNITREALNFYANAGGGTNGYAGGVYFRYTADAEL